MDDIAVIVTGARELALKLDALPTRLHDDLYARIGALTDELEGRVLGVVPKRTGRLESEITKFVIDKPDYISGRVRVSAEFAKAAALEYGAHGTANIAAHQMLLTQVFGHALVAPISVLVDAYQRQMNIEARRFLRGPEEAMRGEVEEALRETVDRVVAE